MTTGAANSFSKIYSSHHWGGTSRSGPGSDPAMVGPYVTVLRSVIARKEISSVVDLGCGDWALSRTIDWQGLDYTGVEIVPDLVSALSATFSGPHVRFVCADLVRDELPSADLCIVKDVLQHLSNQSVSAFLSRLQQKYRFALLTNDISHVERTGWRTLWARSEMEPNRDIADGGYRPLRLTAPPFDLEAERLCVFDLRLARFLKRGPGTVIETKEVLLWKNDRT